MRKLSDYAWLIFLIIGVLFVAFGLYNAFYIPAIDPVDPDQGWEWLTTNPEIIEYIKFNFRMQGWWVMGMGVFVAALTADGYRRRTRTAWIAMWYVPIHLVLLTFMMPWLMFILLPMIVIAVGTQAVSYRGVFGNRSAA